MSGSHIPFFPSSCPPRLASLFEPIHPGHGYPNGALNRQKFNGCVENEGQTGGMSGEVNGKAKSKGASEPLVRNPRKLGRETGSQVFEGF